MITDMCFLLSVHVSPELDVMETNENQIRNQLFKLYRIYVSVRRIHKKCQNIFAFFAQCYITIHTVWNSQYLRNWTWYEETETGFGISAHKCFGFHYYLRMGTESVLHSDMNWQICMINTLNELSQISPKWDETWQNGGHFRIQRTQIHRD